MRSAWLDGARARACEVTPLGGGRWRVAVDAGVFEATVESLGDGWLRITTEAGTTTAVVTRAEGRRFVRLDHADFVLEVAPSGRPAAPARPGGGLESPMPGVVTRVLVAAGDRVGKGQPLLAIEAMKMEHLIRSPREGRVREVRARPGDLVEGGVPLVEMDGA
jgi:3-methylcrotonyl-CoA carboxylase alpha subunit